MDNPGTLNKDNGSREGNQDLRTKAEQLKEQAGEKAEDLKRELTTRTGHLRERISSGAARVASTIGEKIEDASEAMRERLPEQGRLGRTAGAVADRLQRAGNYLQETGFQGMVKDLTGVVQRYPMQSLALGAGIGYLIGRWTRR